jgi:holo-[acyl-carrier protein] synthase
MNNGIDVTSIERIERLAKEEAFTSRVFTRAELASGAKRRNTASWLAACFAAKEAFMKALGTGWTGGVSWQGIEIRDAGTRHELSLSGAAKELTNGRHTHLSVSYSKKLAIATVIIEP